ncbi:hypothetical protein BGZ73_009224, partial [Actinomortierella ambigua]
MSTCDRKKKDTVAEIAKRMPLQRVDWKQLTVKEAWEEFHGPPSMPPRDEIPSGHSQTQDKGPNNDRSQFIKLIKMKIERENHE